MHTLLFYEPGHFHAALTLRVRNPRVSDEIHLYARPGPDRDAFCALVDAFNRREQDPTAWRLHVHEPTGTADPLQMLLDAPPGDAVVLAGRNDRKLATIDALHAAGLHVLADKPWATGSHGLDALERVTRGDALALDIMTGRHDVIARLRRRLTGDPELFGRLGPGDPRAPAVEMGLVHHLLKTVNGAPLRRPAWYYDVTVQGDGLVDVQSHMTDQAQWLIGENPPLRFRDDVRLERAERWPTPVPLDLYRESTGASAFDDALASDVEDGVLQLRCNGRITYQLRGIWVQQTSEWRGREPAGAGDLHHTRLLGERAEITVHQGPETRYRAELRVRPRPGAEADVERRLGEDLAAWQPEFPGASVSRSEHGLEVRIPDAIRSGHEAHFAMVLESFLDRLDTGAREERSAATIRTRYELLARAHDAATDGPAPAPRAETRR